MKSQRLRTYDYMDKTYQFNRYAFIDALTSACNKKGSNGERIRITQSSLFEQIADQLYITPEAVKNWKSGYNSPVELHYIEVCANVLGVEILSLLSPVDTQEEATELTEKEISLIEKVYEECIKSMYMISNLFDKEHSTREQRYLQSISSIHQMIDSSLFVSSSVRYRLHRIACDMSESNIFRGMSVRWENINSIRISDCQYQDKIASIYELFLYQRSDIRGGEVDDNDLYYIEEEKALAEKLGYEYPDIPEAYYNNETEDMPKDYNGNPKKINDVCNIRGAEDFEINGNILFKDMMTRFIKMVFAHDFPELNLPESCFINE